MRAISAKAADFAALDAAAAAFLLLLLLLLSPSYFPPSSHAFSVRRPASPIASRWLDEQERRKKEATEKIRGRNCVILTVADFSAFSAFSLQRPIPPKCSSLCARRKEREGRHFAAQKREVLPCFYLTFCVHFLHWREYSRLSES